MAIGVRVWIGVNPLLRAGDEDYCDTRTVAGDMTTCNKLIRSFGLPMEPHQKLLILKGQMDGRT